MATFSIQDRQALSTAPTADRAQRAQCRGADATRRGHTAGLAALRAERSDLHPSGRRASLPWPRTPSHRQQTLAADLPGRTGDRRRPADPGGAMVDRRPRRRAVVRLGRARRRAGRRALRPLAEARGDRRSPAGVAGCARPATPDAVGRARRQGSPHNRVADQRPPGRPAPPDQHGPVAAGRGGVVAQRRGRGLDPGHRMPAAPRPAQRGTRSRRPVSALPPTRSDHRDAGSGRAGCDQPGRDRVRQTVPTAPPARTAAPGEATGRERPYALPGRVLHGVPGARGDRRGTAPGRPSVGRRHATPERRLDRRRSSCASRHSSS